MFLKLEPGTPIERVIRQFRILLIVNLVLVAILYVCFVDLAAGGLVSSWFARVSAEQAQRQVEDDAYRKWLRENER